MPRGRKQLLPSFSTLSSSEASGIAQPCPLHDPCRIAWCCEPGLMLACAEGIDRLDRGPSASAPHQHDRRQVAKAAFVEAMESAGLHDELRPGTPPHP